MWSVDGRELRRCVAAAAELQFVVVNHGQADDAGAKHRLAIDEYRSAATKQIRVREASLLFEPVRRHVESVARARLEEGDDRRREGMEVERDVLREVGGEDARAASSKANCVIVR